MGENDEEPLTEDADLYKRLPEQDVKKEEVVSSSEEGQVKEDKKTSDAILDELFSSIRESGAVSFKNHPCGCCVKTLINYRLWTLPKS